MDLRQWKYSMTVSSKPYLEARGEKSKEISNSKAMLNTTAPISFGAVFSKKEHSPSNHH
jgi:hypothetical protein